MESSMTLDRLSEARGQTVYGSDGEKIGSVEDVYYDEQTRQPEWVSVSSGLLGTKRTVVPLQGADMRGDGLYVPYSKDQVTNAPSVDEDEISEDAERSLYSHYGLSYSEERSDSVLPEGAPGTTGGVGTPTFEREGAVTRHEEELQVGKRETQAGRARLRKWVETEPAQVDVELLQEAARVTREPVDQPASGAEIGEEEVEVGLRREEPVVEKETVARERVGLEKDVETERETVGGEVRKERVDVEGDTDRT